MELKVVKIEAPKDAQLILGTSHFIKTVEDLYETVAGAVPNAKFGIGFCESSGPCPDIVVLFVIRESAVLSAKTAPRVSGLIKFSMALGIAAFFVGAITR